MKTNSTFKSLLGLWIALLSIGAHAANNTPKSSSSSCAAQFLQTELGSDPDFKAKFDLIHKAGWSIELDKGSENAGFFQSTDFDPQFAVILEKKIADLKASRSPIPTQLLSRLNNEKNEHKTIVVNPSSLDAKSAIRALVENAHFYETVDFIGFIDFLQIEISQVHQRIVPEHLLERAFIAVLREKAARKTSHADPLSEDAVAEITGSLGARFGLPQDIMRGLWEVQIPRKFQK